MRVCSTATVFVVALTMATSGGALADGNRTRAIDAAKSTAEFAVRHVFIERVTGTVPIVSGSLTLQPDSWMPVAATAVLDATMITTAERDQTNSLRGPDFFDTKRFPTWTFTSTAVTPHGATAFGLDGMLTIHGVTQPEHLDVTISGEGDHALYHASGRIDRHAFGMTVTRLDAAIGSTVDVTLTIATAAPRS